MSRHRRPDDDNEEAGHAARVDNVVPPEAAPAGHHAQDAGGTAAAPGPHQPAEGARTPTRHQPADDLRPDEPDESDADGPGLYDDGYDDEQDEEPAPAGRGRRPQDRSELTRTAVRGIGQTFITLGVIVLLFVVYELYVTDWFNNAKQSELRNELEHQWAEDPTVAGPTLPTEKFSDVPLGQGFAIVRIPRFGADWAKVVLEGTEEEELVDGPGHYVNTAMPGEVGNFALAGHRVGKGSPFLNLDQLGPGDPIVIETADSWFVYRVLGADDPNGVPAQQIVPPTDVDVIEPVPNAPGVEANGAYITLTTCHPKFSAEQRLIVHGVLDGQPLPKSQYPQAADVPALLEK